MNIFTDEDIKKYNNKTSNLPKDISIMLGDKQYSIIKSAMYVNAPLKWVRKNDK